MGNLKMAETYFAKTTHYKLYVPGIWFYLAIINFKLGENYKALECWRYARLVSLHNDYTNQMYFDIILLL